MHNHVISLILLQHTPSYKMCKWTYPKTNIFHIYSVHDCQVSITFICCLKFSFIAGYIPWQNIVKYLLVLLTERKQTDTQKTNGQH